MRIGKTPLYERWRTMKRRCADPKRRDFKYYGGRGIRVCVRWQRSFQAFLKDMGKPPAGKTLDRRNNDGHYTPSNCRWASMVTQIRNRRS